jgi:hypothetical protein
MWAFIFSNSFSARAAPAMATASTRQYQAATPLGGFPWVSPEAGSDSSEALREAAVKHYDACYWDYLFAWSSRNDLALHYGYWDENWPTHSESLLN